MAAKSTTAGTPVKSYKTTQDGLKGISTYFSEVFSQSKISLVVYSVNTKLSLFLREFSNKILIE